MREWRGVVQRMRVHPAPLAAAIPRLGPWTCAALSWKRLCCRACQVGLLPPASLTAPSASCAGSVPPRSPCRLQQSDVNDPWLQQEWGLMLVASGRTQEALAHLEVAGGCLQLCAGWCCRLLF